MDDHDISIFGEEMSKAVINFLDRADLNWGYDNTDSIIKINHVDKSNVNQTITIEVSLISEEAD